MGLSIRGYAQHRGALGLPGASHTAVRKALAAGRITAEPDGSIDPVRADAQWAGQTDPSMQRGAAAQAQAAETRAASGQGPAPTRPVPRAALDAVQETLAEAGQDPEPEAGGQVTLVRAKLAREIITAQLLKVKLQREKGELVDRARAVALVFDLARRERDAWIGWPARVAANMAAELGADPHQVEQLLERYLREQLASLAEVKVELR